jgi:protein tyrosine/serine phosphatase
LAANGRLLSWEALLNARDLGGIPSAHGPVRHGAIVRSDALYRLNEAGHAALVAYGVRTVIDMRAQLFHCEVGKDRTGLMTMVLLDLVAVAPEVIAEDYALTAIGLAPLFADLIAKAETDERRTRLQEEALCRADIMLTIHRMFREYHGDAEAYLRASGMTATAIDALRRRMLNGASHTTPSRGADAIRSPSR